MNRARGVLLILTILTFLISMFMVAVAEERPDCFPPEAFPCLGSDYADK